MTKLCLKTTKHGMGHHTDCSGDKPNNKVTKAKGRGISLGTAVVFCSHYNSYAQKLLQRTLMVPLR